MKFAVLLVPLIAVVTVMVDCRSQLGRADSQHSNIAEEKRQFDIILGPYRSEETTSSTAEPQQIKESMKLEETVRQAEKGKKSCDDVGGECLSKKKENKCDGNVNKKAKCDKKKEVCCVSTPGTSDSSKKCEENGGECMSKKKCFGAGTINKDYRCSKKICCVSATGTTKITKPSKGTDGTDAKRKSTNNPNPTHTTKGTDDPNPTKGTKDPNPIKGTIAQKYWKVYQK